MVGISYKNSLEKRHLNNKELIYNYIKTNPGLTFRQIGFRMELNESTLNKALINLIKTEFIRKSEDKRYFKKWN